MFAGFYRYSYHHKLIPLLLISFFDEVEDISKSTIQLWDKVVCEKMHHNLDFIFNKIGAKYEEENEKDLKDQMDFPSQPNIPSQLS